MVFELFLHWVGMLIFLSVHICNIYVFVRGHNFCLTQFGSGQWVMVDRELIVYMQGLFVPFACIGSGDPVRVLRLYTMNTLDTLWSIYCWDLCTTCHYRIYVLLAQALWLWDFLLLIRTLLKYLAKCTLTLYCVVTYICACVDASRMVFWDHSVLC